MKFDELNKLFKNYFSVMEISEEDRKKRVDCAFSFYEAIWFVLSLIRMELKNGTLQTAEEYKQSLRNRLSEFLYGEYEDYIDWFVDDFIDTTFRHLDDEDDDEEDDIDDYFISERRAILSAQNEANTVMNRRDYKEAKDSGKEYKRWITEGDERVRLFHQEVDSMEIPIDEYFPVGNDLMLYPHDINGSPENVINCRCSCIYS